MSKIKTLAVLFGGIGGYSHGATRKAKLQEASTRELINELNRRGRKAG